VCDPRRPTTMVQGHDRYHRWEFQLQPGEDPQQMNEIDNVWRLLSTWITPDKARLVRSAPYTFHAVVAATMRKGRVLLAGDAAHQMPPFMGQGLNSGQRDAMNLAWKLAWVLNGWSGDGLLDSYSLERRAHAKSIVEQSVEAGQLIDQFAGRVSHGITPHGGYGGGRQINGYIEGIVTGSHPRVGRPYRNWHEAVPAPPVNEAMIVASSVPVPVPLPTRGRWTSVSLDRELLFDSDHVVIRPDGWVAAICSDAELPQVLRELDARLAG
jgi:FAD binding domain